MITPSCLIERVEEYEERTRAPPLNGRQVKNVIQTAIDLEHCSGEMLSVERFGQVINIHLELDKELSA